MEQLKEQPNEIEKLKKEILSEIKPAEKNKKRLQWSSLTVTSVLVVLTVLATVQAVQSDTILNKINSGAINAAGPVGSASAPLPSNLQNLPNMVGGC